jgi:hypothetical protein
MAKIIILIKPFKENICVGVNELFCEKIISIVKKNKIKKSNLFIETGKTGYNGMMLINNGNTKVYVNHDNVIYFNNNIIEIYIDSQKKIYNLFLKAVIKKYYDVLRFHFDVSNCTKNKS